MALTPSTPQFDMKTLKSFWQKPEGKLGMLVIGLLLAAVLFNGVAIMAFLVALLTNTIEAVVLGVVLVGMLMVVTHKTFRSGVSNLFQSTMRWFTGLVIEIDPIGILKNTLDRMKENLAKLSVAIGKVNGAHNLKLVLLAFSMSVFMVTSMLDVLAAIPKEKFDLARTLRMGEWQVVWEVMVLGRADVMFDVIRQNAAIGWMMLPMVEGLWKSEGGIGAILDIQNKHFGLETIAAINCAIVVCGLSQDYLIGVIKGIACPYASLLLERR